MSADRLRKLLFEFGKEDIGIGGHAYEVSKVWIGFQYIRADVQKGHRVFRTVEVGEFVDVFEDTFGDFVS